MSYQRMFPHFKMGILFISYFTRVLECENNVHTALFNDVPQNLTEKQSCLSVMDSVPHIEATQIFKTKNKNKGEDYLLSS